MVESEGSIIENGTVEFSDCLVYILCVHEFNDGLALTLPVPILQDLHMINLSNLPHQIPKTVLTCVKVQVSNEQIGAFSISITSGSASLVGFSWCLSLLSSFSEWSLWSFECSLRPFECSLWSFKLLDGGTRRMHVVSSGELNTNVLTKELDAVRVSLDLKRSFGFLSSCKFNESFAISRVLGPQNLSILFKYASELVL